MGVDYSGSIHKWFIGHSATSPGTLQDDLAVISGKIKAREPAGGDGYRADDAANTIATATPLTDDGAGLQYASGIIERMNDVDAFSFISDGNPQLVSAVPDLPSGLDARLEIYDGDGHLLAAKDAATNDQQVALTLPAGTYYVTVSSHGDYGDLGLYDLSVRALPAGWNSADVGTTGLTGYTQFDAATGTFTNTGAGPAVSGTTDAFRFAWQSLTGDGEIVARVTQNQNTNSAAKVGVEIRDGLAAGAKHAAIILTPSGQVQFISRSSTNGSASVLNGATPGLSTWVRLTRVGNVITGYTSPDGVSWTQVSQATVSMSAVVNIGLLTASLTPLSPFTSLKLDTGKIDNVTVTGDTTVAPSAYNTLPAPANLAAVPAATGTGLTLTWDEVLDATGYAVFRSADGITFSQIATPATGTLTYTDPNPGATMRYFYRVAALDAVGLSVPSATASAVNRPPAPSGVSITNWNTTSIVVNWKDVSGDLGYRIERSSDAGATWTSVATVGTNFPAWTNSGLPSATTYSYRVITLSPAGESAPSTAATGSTRLAAVGGIAIDSSLSNAVAFHWSDITLETGYRIERSTNGTTWSTLTNVPANQTTYTDTTVTPLGEYYYRVFGTAGAALSLTPANYAFTATPATSALPAPWVSANIGSVPGTGAAGYSGTTFTLISGGSDINSTSDNFRFTSQPLVGDGTITARVNSVENTDANAKAGVMIRASTAANAPYVAILLTPGAGILVQSRATTGVTTTVTTALASVTAPYWVRLTRAGNTFTASYSTDGATFNFAPQVTLNAFPTSALVGLATASHTTNTLSVASIGSVTVSNAAPTVATAASANPNPVVTGNTTTLSVLGADDHGEAALTYNWTVLSVPPGPLLLSLSGNNGTNASKNVVATFGRAGDYTFRVTITDANGLSTTSTVNVTVSTVFPAVAGMAFDYHRAVSVTFNKNLGASISTDDLSLQPLAGGAAMTPANVTWNAATFTATFTFADDLPDGDYRATLLAAGVNDTANLHPSADATFDFFAFAGDLNRDRVIDFDDLVVLAQNYNTSGKTYLEGDFTGDGNVDFNDLAVLAQRYNLSLGDVPTPAAPAIAAAAAATPTLAQTSKESLFSTARITPPKPKPIARPGRHTR
jgi:regulation of enolase protein 1 (concanavalin A-like superfamily)